MEFSTKSAVVPALPSFSNRAPNVYSTVSLCYNTCTDKKPRKFTRQFEGLGGIHLTSETNTPKSNVAGNAEAKQTKLIHFNKATYGEVIRYYRLKLGLNTVQFAEKIHSSKNNVCNWETGRARPDINLLPGICAGLGISIGKFFGLPSTDKELSLHEQRLLSHYNSLSPENQKLIDTMLETMLDSQDREFRLQCERGFERIFHNDNCSAAGVGYALSDQARGEYVYIRTSRNACLADEIITVSGDSMEPTLHTHP